MKTFFSLFLVISCCASVSGQFLDLARVEYTNVPGDRSSFDYQRQRAVFNYPFRIKNNGYFFVGMDYSQIHFNYREDVDTFIKEETDEFTQLELNLTYLLEIKNDWRFGVQFTPRLSSNLESTIEGADFVFSGVVAFIKDRKDTNSVEKPNRIIIGAAYFGISAIVFPIPFIGYYRKIHPKWAYNVGAPVTDFQFHASDQFKLMVFATLDGFNANVQEEQTLATGDQFNRLRINMVLTGMRFEYNFSEHIESFLTISRSVTSAVQLRDKREKIVSLPADNVMHYRIGVRFRID